MDKYEEMIAVAIDNLKNSYAPYSKYNVSAVVLASSGKLYPGVNVENAAYSITSCAERNALFRAISDGERQIEAIALVGGREAASGAPIAEYCKPCGMCRQALREFADPRELKIISAKSVTDYKVCTLEDILPESFGPADYYK